MISGAETSAKSAAIKLQSMLNSSTKEADISLSLSSRLAVKRIL